MPLPKTRLYYMSMERYLIVLLELLGRKNGKWSQFFLKTAKRTKNEYFKII